MENILAYYDEQNFRDWTHAETGAPTLKAQHPEFELWNQGIHARAARSFSSISRKRRTLPDFTRRRRQRVFSGIRSTLRARVKTPCPLHADLSSLAPTSSTFKFTAA